MELNNNISIEVIPMERANEVSGGSLYSEANDLYEAAKEFGSAFWKGAKEGYGLE